jgi:hypothetical protein
MAHDPIVTRLEPDPAFEHVYSSLFEPSFATSSDNDRRDQPAAWGKQQRREGSERGKLWTRRKRELVLLCDGRLRVAAFSGSNTGSKFYRTL